MTIAQPAWTGMVPVDDTALAVTDTGGPGAPVIYLNGQFGTQSQWRRVIAELGSGYRHVTYDERARGGSKLSADYSFEAGVRDIGTVLAAGGVNRPVILVGWSYGAALAVQWAGRYPDRVLGLVSVDGAYPYDYTDEASLDNIRRQFRRLRWAMPLLRPLGLAARMSAAEQAEINIELLQVVAKLGPALESLTVPARFMIASGGSLGGGKEQMERMRATLGPVLARNPQLKSVKVASSHTQVLRKDFRAVADAVRELATTHSQQADSHVSHDQ
ncbi:MAG TPA: alpha/beta hydrolase [Jatrophihabitantaceae bacterium]|jgi:pimeloyl-ACP methyl ester carboxylesterase